MSCVQIEPWWNSSRIPLRVNREAGGGLSIALYNQVMSEAPLPLRIRVRRRPRVNPIGVVGEVLVTMAVLTFLFLGWQLWFNNVVASSGQREAAEVLSEKWNSEPQIAQADDIPVVAGEPVVMAAPEAAAAFANLIIPSLGADYKRSIGEGIGPDVLNSLRLGIGHYPQTQLPGQVGNFALAAHRSAYGGAFRDIHQLAVGDAIYVETADGWYKYVFRGLEYVRASGIGVILPVPQNAAATATERMITLTTCNPFYSTRERMIAYGIFDSWYPRADGPPAEIVDIATATTGD